MIYLALRAIVFCRLLKVLYLQVLFMLLHVKFLFAADVAWASGGQNSAPKSNYQLGENKVIQKVDTFALLTF